MAQVQTADYAVVNPATGEVVKEYPTISDEDLKKLPAADRAKVYRARLTASGWQPPAAKS